MTVFDATNREDHTKSTLFFGKPVTLARYDKMKYPWLDKLSRKQRGFFWQPDEVVLSRDKSDFAALTDSEKHIFTSNLKRQILLDSVQGRAPTQAFGPICSLPELEHFLNVWTFFEQIHSDSYTHIIRNIYPNPSKVFDEMLDIQEIVDCAKDISEHYDHLIGLNNMLKFWGGHVPAMHNGPTELDHKKALWLTLLSVNALEGIRFYVSFACSWAFAEVKKMEGNAKIIRFICRDENIHLAATQQLLKALPKEDPDFAAIAEETREEAQNIFVSAVDQEKAWAKYLFADGSMVGLNESLLCEYVEWIAHKRMGAIGLSSPFKGGSNPLPWTQDWIASGAVQVAPQETEQTLYINGGVKKDVTNDTFKGFSL